MKPTLAPKPKLIHPNSGPRAAEKGRSSRLIHEANVGAVDHHRKRPGLVQPRLGGETKRRKDGEWGLGD